ncbi:MAG: hypothetical protein AAF666_13440 [Pseudomonadota bacterium]
MHVDIVIGAHRIGTQKECAVLADRISSTQQHSAALHTPISGLRGLVQGAKWAWVNAADAVLIYNVSMVNLAIALIYRLRRRRVIWMNHEPMGFGHKRINNSLAYSVQVCLAEFMFGALSTSIGTPSRPNAGKYGQNFFPLQYQLDPVTPDHAEDGRVSYLGRLDETRFLYGFKRLDQYGLKPRFFPSGADRSEAAKRDFLETTDFVVNIYRRAHAQSGVTPDALSAMVPVIVGANDAWATEDWGGYLHIVDESLSDAELSLKIRDIAKAAPQRDEAVFRQTFENSFGPSAFQRHWLPVLDTVSGNR